MPAAAANGDSTLPVIDLSNPDTAQVGEQLFEAFRDIGFCYVSFLF